MSGQPPVPTPAGAAPSLRKVPYRHFVKPDADSIDLIDHVAYGLYKRDKLAFIESFEKANNCKPQEADFDAFFISSTLPNRVESYRGTATELLRDFSEEVLTEAETEVEERYKTKFNQELRKVRPFWRTLADNVLANIGTIVLVAFVLVAIYGSRIGAVNLVGEVFNYDIKERAPNSGATSPSPSASTPAKL